MRQASVRMLHREGTGEARWILLDYQDVVIHIFDEQTRQFYDLERLWARCARSSNCSVDPLTGSA